MPLYFCFNSGLSFYKVLYKTYETLPKKTFAGLNPYTSFKETFCGNRKFFEAFKMYASVLFASFK